MDRIHIAASPGERRIAVLCDDVLTDYAIWRPGAPDGIGDLHRARVIARVPAMAGSFLALADTEAFLPDSACPAPPLQGDHLTVRITRAAHAGKGPRVAMAAAPVGMESGPVRRLQAGPTVLDRLASSWPDAAMVVDDPQVFATLRPAYGSRLSLVRAAFDPVLKAEIDDLAVPVAALPQGMRASISPTPALVAIDIDSGGATGARGEKSPSQLAANRGCLVELARQIRLRNLSGAILIDFAGMPAKRRSVLGPDLVKALAQDPLRPRLAGFSILGFAEVLRPRLAAPLHEVLRGPHAAGLRALQAAAAACAHAATRLRATPEINAALESDIAAMAELAGCTTYPLMLRSDPSLPAQSWIIEDARA